MIKTKSESKPYITEFTNGNITCYADTSSDKKGEISGFRPHELLEAALAACMNMTIRMYAEIHDIKLDYVSTTVALDRSTPEESRFEYNTDISGDVTEAQKKRIMEIIESCPVRKTLSKAITFMKDTNIK